LFSFPQSAVRHRSRARSAQAKESLRVANLSKVSKDYCCRCAQSRSSSTFEVSEGCRKECVQEIFFKARSCEKLRRSKAFENIEGHRKVCSASGISPGKSPWFPS
jgi:hypothetical protein